MLPSLVLRRVTGHLGAGAACFRAPARSRSPQRTTGEKHPLINRWQDRRHVRLPAQPRSTAHSVLIAVVVGSAAVWASRSIEILRRFGGDYDEGVYWQSLRALANGHALFGEVFSSQPPLFLSGVRPFYTLLGENIVAAKVPVFVSAIATLAMVFWIGRRVSGVIAGVAATGFAASQPLFLSASGSLLAEMPAIALACLSVLLAYEAHTRGLGKGQMAARFVGSGLALGAAILVKISAVTVLPAIAILIVRRRSSPSPADLGRWWRLLCVSLGALTSVVVILGAFWHGGAVLDQALSFHLQARGLGNGPSDNLRLLLQLSPLTGLQALAGASCLRLLRGRRVRLVPVMAWAASGLIFLVLHDPLFKHHGLVLIPPLALLGGCLVGEAQTLISKRRLAIVFGTGIMLIGNIAALRSGDSSTVPDEQTAGLIQTMREATEPGDLIISDSQYLVAAADRDVPPWLVDTSHVRFRSGYLSGVDLRRATRFPSVRAVLVTGGGRFDQNAPEYRTWLAGRFHVARRLPDGTTLYVRG